MVISILMIVDIGILKGGLPMERDKYYICGRKLHPYKKYLKNLAFQ